ncbi:hypothetical protein ACE3NQ_30410 [Paenibacillus terreus]|uniref:Uncharacterized protein n=1 Tax=Paenibacillus terreus TaxID=1387834 RepID=A0ABV5BL42_9BACL
MSQANLPNITPAFSLTREDAINLIISSIAMEELGLSHILNAEGEKLQYVLGTLPGVSVPAPTLSDLLAINNSIRKTLKETTKKEWVLSNKLEMALKASKCSTEVPVTTKVPVTTEAPVITEVPVTTEAPATTEPPVVAEAPAVAEAPVGTEAEGATAAADITGALGGPCWMVMYPEPVGLTCIPVTPGATFVPIDLPTGTTYYPITATDQSPQDQDCLPIVLPTGITCVPFIVEP